MARTQGSDDLFRLIHSMSAAEKNYFKRYAKRYADKDSKYLQLFDAINQQEQFEEGSLKKDFPAYTVMKVYLFEMIMKNLMVYTSDMEKQEELMREMIYAKMLLRRGLFARAMQLLDKGVATARECELFWIEEEFLRLRVKYSQFSWKAEQMKKKRVEFFTDLEKAHEKQVNQDRFIKERMKIYLLKKSEEYANQSMKISDEKVDLKFLKSEQSALTPGNNRMRLYVLYEYYMVYDDFENAYAIAQKVMQSERKLLLARRADNSSTPYMYALKLRIASCFDTGRINEVGELLDKDWKAAPAAEREKPENENFFFYMKSLYYWMSGRHKEGEKFMDANIGKMMTPEYFEHYAEHLEVILPIKVVIEFSNGNDRKAVLSINEYQNLCAKKSHTKYFKDCELMRILIQAEMQNFEVMDTLIRNTLRKQKQLGLAPLETKFLNSLKKMNQMNLKDVFAELSELFKPGSGNEQADVMWIFYLRDWIESRRTNTPLSEILRRRAENRSMSK